MPSQFVCPNHKCGYAIASDKLNGVQLKGLRRWATKCPKCTQVGTFLEQQTLIDTTQTKSFNGGMKNANTGEDSLMPNGKRRKPNRRN